MFAGSVSMASSLASRMAQAACADAAPRPPRRPPRRPSDRPVADAGRRDGPGRRPKPYEEAQYRAVPSGREPRRHLDGRAAAPAVRGVRPRHPHLRAHRRGDRLQDRRSALRPARARVHEAPLGVVLAHRDLRRGADVHAHHPVSEVHELHDERVLPDVSALRRCSSSPRPSSSTPTTTAGGSSIRWSISAWGSASTSSARRSCSSPTPG